MTGSPNEPGPKPRWPGILIRTALVLTAFGLLAWAIWSNRDQIREVLDERPNPALFVAALGVYLVALLATFVRWYWLVRALGLPFRLRDAMRLGFIGNVFNLVIPGSVGGDVIKAAFLAKEQERRTQAIASMVIDRLLGLLGLFILASLAGLAVWFDPTTRGEIRDLILLAWALVSGGILGMAVLLTPSLYRPLLKLFQGRGRGELLLRELVTLVGAYRKRPGVIVGGALLSAASHALFVYAMVLVDGALYPLTAPSIGRHFVIVPLVFLTMAVPLPFGALGFSEKASEALFDLVGFPGGAVLMMGYRVVMYGSGAISALVLAANTRQVRALRLEADQIALELEEGRLADPAEAAGG